MEPQADMHRIAKDAQRDKRAIRPAQEGDLHALEPVLAQHAEALITVLLGRIGDRALAEDVLRETFLTAMERIGSFGERGPSIHRVRRLIRSAQDELLAHRPAAGAQAARPGRRCPPRSLLASIGFIGAAMALLLASSLLLDQTARVPHVFDEREGRR